MSSARQRLFPFVSASAAVGLTSAAVLAGLSGNASAATNTFTPVADTRVQDNTPTTNYGTSSVLGVDASEIQRSFLKFNISGLTEPITSAKLRLHVDSAAGSESSNGGTWKLMTNTSWSETGVTWNNQPAIDGATLGTLGTVALNTWYEIDVTGKITGNGTFSIGGTSTSTNGADYDSRETGATAPQLVITTGTTPSPSPSTSTPPPPGDPVLVGAGDIANCGTSGDTATSNLLDSIGGTVMAIGDTAYPDGTSSDYTNCYQPTWGRHKSRTKPATGNHEYHTAGAAGYFNYYGAAAGDPNKGYYSYNTGNWHVVALNSNCSVVACTTGSAQEQWLRSDLAANTKPCTVAYWHHPRYTSGASHGPNTSVKPLYQALYDHNAEVIVTGHNHQYERFAPMDANGALDNTRGIRQFVAGMGGTGLGGFGTIQPNSQARNSDTWGVLKLTLHASSYDWQFVPVAGKTYSDSGTTACH